MENGNSHAGPSQDQILAALQALGSLGASNATTNFPFDPNSLLTNPTAMLAFVNATKQLAQTNPAQHSNPLALAAAAPAALVAAMNQFAVANPAAQLPHNLTALFAAAATPGATVAPAPPISYSPPPPTVSQPRRPGNEAALPATVQNRFSAAAQAAAAQAAAQAQISSNSNALQGMQAWSLEQLEQHVMVLQQMKQPVPQSLALLLADARRKEEKKRAKRNANRRSASTSRARKKKLLEEMTETNAKLKRQALILSLLPDLVVVIKEDGEITFCNDQVQRALKINTDDLVGADVRDILVPASQIALGKLVTELINPGKARNQRSQGDDQQSSGNNSREIKDENGNVSAGASSGSGAAVVSDQSFPLSVVKVDSKVEPASDENSDESGNPNPNSSLSNSAPRSPSASLGNSGSGSEDGNRASAAGKEGTAGKRDRLSPSATKGQRLSSSDDSSSGSNEIKTVRKANENLERNVFKKLQSMSKSSKAKVGHKDDVMGDSVIANNAQARLSSLQHHPEKIKSLRKRKSSQFGDSIGDRFPSDDSLMEKKNVNNENASDDSGYRESNDSREETSSSASESSNSNGRIKPLAPTCNVCLIRADLTTMFCEVTSSVRTRNAKDDSEVSMALPEGKSNVPSQEVGGSNKSSMTSTASSEDTQAEMPQEPHMKEILLCLRPIRDGDEKVDESLRFVPSKRVRSEDQERSFIELGETMVVSRAASTSGEPNGASGDTKIEPPRKFPPKKRSLPLRTSTTTQLEQNEAGSSKRTKIQDRSSSSSDTEKSVVESLMLMSNKSN